MATTNYEQQRRRIELARAQATRVPVFVRITATNPHPNANEQIARWASHNAFLRNWPGAVNPSIHTKWRKVSSFTGYFKKLTRLVSDGVALNVEFTSPVTLGPYFEIPSGSKPVFSFQVVPG
jgi:hypothetical protein